MNGRPRKCYLLIEFLALFVALPVVFYLFRRYVAHRVMVLILLTGAFCTVYLVRQHHFPREAFFRTLGWRRHLKKVLLTFALPALALIPLTALFLTDRFLALPREHPSAWLVVLVFYPVLAAYPQEIIFRGFFFHRYRLLFPKQVAMVLVSSLCFAWAHLMYANWIAPVLSAMGGLLFSYRYLRTKSLLVVGLEHGLWGNFLFTVGIGWYFYSGSIQ